MRGFFITYSLRNLYWVQYTNSVQFTYRSYEWSIEQSLAYCVDFTTSYHLPLWKHHKSQSKETCDGENFLPRQERLESYSVVALVLGSVEKKQRDSTDGQMNMDFAWTPLHETKGFAERIRRDEYGVDFWCASKDVLGSTCLLSGWGQLYESVLSVRTPYSSLSTIRTIRSGKSGKNVIPPS